MTKSLSIFKYSTDRPSSGPPARLYLLPLFKPATQSTQKYQRRIKRAKLYQNMFLLEIKRKFGIIIIFYVYRRVFGKFF